MNLLKRMFRNNGSLKLRRRPEHDMEYAGRCWQLTFRGDHIVLLWEDDLDKEVL